MAFKIPFALAFDYEEPVGMLIAEYMLDCLFAVDIFLCMFTTFIVDGGNFCLFQAQTP